MFENIKKRFLFPYCRWYFAMLSISGIFAVTFSVVFAYVADITTDEDRGQAYGLVRNLWLLSPFFFFCQILYNDYK